MRLVVQRVRRARVLVDAQPISAIGPGLLILCGVSRADTPADAGFLARKCAQLRIFNDAEGRMNLGPRDVQAQFLVVSQFTLYGDCAKGNRPSYIEAAPPEEGERGYELFVSELRAQVGEVQTGRFRADMLVEIENDGPVTLHLESTGRVGP